MLVSALVPLGDLSKIWPLTIAYFSIIGFSATYFGISIQTARQMDLADNLRDQVISIWTMVNTGSSAAGAMDLEILTDYARASLVLGLIGALLTTHFVFLLVRRLKQ